MTPLGRRHMAVLELDEPPDRPSSSSCAPPDIHPNVELEDVLLVSTVQLPAEAEHWPVRKQDRAGMLCSHHSDDCLFDPTHRR